MFKTAKKYQKGFTLVECLVAIAILSLSVAATFSAVQNGLQASTIAKDQVIAFYLAQEGMEFVRNTRDQNALFTLGGTATNWLAGLSSVSTDPCYFGKTCTIDSPLKVIATCSGGFGSCPDILQDTSNDASFGLYGYTPTWTDTLFKREIQFQSISANEVTVVINIIWKERGVTQSFQITESLLNHE